MDVDTDVSTSGELTDVGLLAEFSPECEEIVEVIVSVKVVDDSLIVEVIVAVSASGGVLEEAGSTFGPAAEFEVIVSVKVVDGSLIVEVMVVSTPGGGEFGPIADVERIVEVSVSVKVVDGLITVETVVWVVAGIIAELRPRTDVEKIVEVAVSTKVVDGAMTVERVVWVAMGKTQLMTPDWLKSISLASPEPPVIMAFVQVGDI
jgi:hypothetical protein